MQLCFLHFIHLYGILVSPGRASFPQKVTNIPGFLLHSHIKHDQYTWFSHAVTSKVTNIPDFLMHSHIPGFLMHSHIKSDQYTWCSHAQSHQT